MTELDILHRRMVELDKVIAAAQSEQASLWAAVRRCGGRLQPGPSGMVHTIVDAVCQEFGVSRSELLGDRRAAVLVTARQAACWLARTLTPLSYPVIGRVLFRDHTTVIHSVQVADLRIGRDGTFAHQLVTLQAELAPLLCPDLSAKEAA